MQLHGRFKKWARLMLDEYVENLEEGTLEEMRDEAGPESWFMYVEMLTLDMRKIAGDDYKHPGVLKRECGECNGTGKIGHVDDDGSEFEEPCEKCDALGATSIV